MTEDVFGSERRTGKQAESGEIEFFGGSEVFLQPGDSLRYSVDTIGHDEETGKATLVRFSIQSDGFCTSLLLGPVASRSLASELVEASEEIEN